MAMEALSDNIDVRNLLVLDRSFQLFLDARNLALQTPRTPLPIVDFDGAGNAAAIFLHALIAYKLHFQRRRACN